MIGDSEDSIPVAPDDVDPLQEVVTRWWIQFHGEELGRHHARISCLITRYADASTDEILFDIGLLTQLARARTTLAHPAARP